MNLNRESDGKNTLKAGIYSVFTNIVSMLVSLISVSLLSNIMSTSDMGISTSFITLQTVISYICLLSIYTSINRLLLEKDKNIDVYFSTIVIFSIVSIIIYYIIYLFFQEPIFNVLGFDKNIMTFLFVSILFENIFLYIYTKWNFYNNYIKCLLYNLITSPLSQIMSLLFVYNINREHYWGRIIGLKFFPIVLGLIFAVYILFKGKFKFNKSYLKYGIRLSLPIVFHLLSQIILSNSDLLMIKGIIGDSEAGIYSIAYTIGNVLFMTIVCILKPWSPWVYRRMENNEIDAIYINSKNIILINFILAIGLITIAPEMINIFLNKSYANSIYLISPICLGMYFQGIYMLYYDVEYYYKNTKNIAIFSIIAALLNIILNYIFINKFGYVAAAYTTFISYLILALMHFVGMKLIDKRKIIDNKAILFYSLLLILLSFISLIFINKIIYRYLIFITIFLVIIILERKKIANIIEKILGNNMTVLFKFIKLYRFLIFRFDNFIKVFVKPQRNKSSKKQVIIITNLGLGDAMDFLCISDKYKIIYPEDKYEITLLCSPASYELLKNETNFNHYIKMNMNKTFSNSLNLIARLKEIIFLRKTKYDILIDQMWPFTILPASVFISNIIQANEKIISINIATLQISKRSILKIYNKINELNDITLTNIEMYNSVPLFIANFNGIKLDNNIIYKKTKNVKINLKLPKKYYIVFPSSTSEKKNWESEKYLEIIRKIYKKLRIPVVFCGTEADKTIVEKIKKNLDNKMYIDVLGETNILEFIQIVKDSKFVITNDTGAYHIAIINEVPVTIITGGYTFDSFVTYNFKGNHYKKPYIVTNKRQCFNCHLKCIYNNYKRFPCLSSVTIDDAWKVIDEMIKKEYKNEKEVKKDERNN